MTNFPRIASLSGGSRHIERSKASPSTTALAQSIHFTRENWRKLITISVIVLLPCFWHRHIEASDLGSHTYNAWLAQLIEHGQVAGLHIARVWDNVLFDLVLGSFGKLVPILVAEKIAVSLMVLVFFWGAFAFVSAAAKRAPWYLVPAIAMTVYGWTFETGFCNYYLSLGISFFALAIFWRGKGWERLILFALAPFVLLAHPIGLAWMLGAAIYMELCRVIPGRYQSLLFLAAAAAIFLVRRFLFHHYIADAEVGPLYFFSGADQFILYGSRYWVPAAAFLIFIAAIVGTDLIGQRREPAFWLRLSLPVQLYLLVALGILWLPDGIHLPQFPAALALIAERVTSISLVLLCCLASVGRPRKWHLVGFSSIAIVFFTFLYQDTGTISRMETQVEHLLGPLPPGQRVLGTIWPPSGSRVLVQHIVDRACIGRCFSYGNYEPASRAFRVRVTRPNRYAMNDFKSTSEMEAGTYMVGPQDLPAYQIYQCRANWTELRIRPLAEGEDNGRLGFHSNEKSPAATPLRN